jgi:hypothetical protein
LKPQRNEKKQGILTEGEDSLELTSSLRWLVLLKMVNNILNTKRRFSKPVSARRSTVLSLPFQLGFPE